MSDDIKITKHPGYIRYSLNDITHREDGPAIISDSGNHFYVINGKFHRENGPAISYSNGNKEWWYNGYKINVLSQKEFEDYLLLKIFT